MNQYELLTPNNIVANLQLKQNENKNFNTYCTQPIQYTQDSKRFNLDPPS